MSQPTVSLAAATGHRGAEGRDGFRHPNATVGAAGLAAAAVVGAAAALGPAVGAATLVAVALGLVVLWRPDVGALVLVALVPAISGLARGLVVPGLRLSEVLIAGMSALILWRAGARRRVPWGVFDWLALAYLVATAALGAFDLLQRGGPFTIDTVGTLIGPLQFLLLYRAVRTALPSPEQRRAALALLLVASVPVSVLALLQQFDVAGARQLVTTLTGTDIYATTVQNVFGVETPAARATGPFPHWHDLAGYLLVVVVLSFGLLVEGSGRVLPRPALVAILAIAGVALVQTASAAPIIGACAGVLAIALWARRRPAVLGWTMLAAVFAAIAFAPLLESRIQQQLAAAPGTQPSLVPQTLQYRYGVWQQFVPVLHDRLLTGYGPDLPPGLSFPHAESLYVELLLRGGVPLLAVYAALTWALAAGALRTTRHADPDARVVGRVVLVVVCLLVLIHLISTYFLDSGPPHLLWALAGLLAWPAAGSPTARSPA